MCAKSRNRSRFLLNLGALNCHGLRDKIDLPVVINLISSCDIFGVNETWLKDDEDEEEDNEDEISVEGFEYYPLNRKCKKGPSRGGIGVFIKNELKDNIKIRYHLSNDDVLWCCLKKKFFGYNDDVYVGIVYIPPETSTREKRLNIDHFQILQENVSKINSENIVLLGDFNARTGASDDVLLAEKHQDPIHFNFFSNIESNRSNQDHGTNAYGEKLN